MSSKKVRYPTHSKATIKKIVDDFNLDKAKGAPEDSILSDPGVFISGLVVNYAEKSASKEEITDSLKKNFEIPERKAKIITKRLDRKILSNIKKRTEKENESRGNPKKRNKKEIKKPNKKQDRYREPIE